MKHNPHLEDRSVCRLQTRMGEREVILLEVVRGHKPWTVLQRHGLNVSYYDGSWEFGVESDPPLLVSPSDISEGLLGLSSRPREQREWASFILAASSLLDLEYVQACDLLLEALWEATFGEPVQQSAYDLARSLIRGGRETVIKHGSGDDERSFRITNTPDK
jgi:hypothetical protein